MVAVMVKQLNPVGCEIKNFSLQKIFAMDSKEDKFKTSKIAHQKHINVKMCDNGKLQYNCTACGKTFCSRSQQYYHINCNQLQQMSYKCPHCNKAFARYSQLKYHIQSHISPLNKCHKCQKIFANPLALKKHTALHKVKPKLCPHCDKSFLKKESLEQHIAAQHLNQLQHCCAHCSKKYSSKSSLQLHLQTHQNKRFECLYCGKLFYRKSVLNVHLKRHYNTNGYMCAVCHKVFSESGALARHNKIHEENVIQYFCKLCNKGILRKDNMNRHVNTIHPDEKFVDIVEIRKHMPSKTNDIIEAETESNKNKSFVIIENKLIKQQNYTQVNTDILTSRNNDKNLENGFVHIPVKNQIAQDIPYNPFYGTTKIETNCCEFQNQTDKYSTLQNSCNDTNNIKSFFQKFIATDKHLNINKSESNVKNNAAAIKQNGIQELTESETTTQTISSVIRSIGNVNKNLTFINVTNNNNNNNVVANNRTNSEYKHKKYCHNNYNLELYRRILGCDEEMEDNQHQETNNKISSDLQQNIKQKSAPVHWRKSFKTNYETSASNNDNGKF